jgi:hypothetical protein
MRRLFGRASTLSEEDRARLAEAERLVQEFEATLDNAIEFSADMRADGVDDQELRRLVSHRINWRSHIRQNLKAAKKAFEQGDRAQGEELLRRATSRANQGTDDLVGRLEELVNEEIRPPEGSAAAASYVPIGDPRLRLIRELPVGACFNENMGADGRGHGYVEVPCSEPHELEMFGRGDVQPRFSKFPDAETLAAEGDRVCRPLFEQYVGLDYNLSKYTFWAFYPERDRWPEDRTIHCALGNADRSLHERGSAKGINE